MNEKIKFMGRENLSESKETAENLSIDSISQLAKSLNDKIATAQKIKDENIEKQLNDREFLIAEQKNNDELILEAQKALDYFDSLDQANLELLDDDGKEQLQQLKETMVTLKRQRTNINNKINGITDNAEVYGKLRDQAGEEDKKLELKKEYELGLEKFLHETDEWLQETEVLKAKQIEFNNLYKEYFTTTNLYTKINDIFSQARSMAKEIHNKIGGIGDKMRSDIEKDKLDYISSLTEIKNSLGTFSFKDKAAIEYILARSGEIDGYVKKIKSYNDLEVEVDEMRKDLKAKYQNIIKRAQDFDYNFESNGVVIKKYLPHMIDERIERYTDNNKDIKALMNFF